MAIAANAPKATLGWVGFSAGAAALMLSIVIFWAGPFAPQQSAGVSLGELAAEVAKSAARSVAGREQPDPVIQTRDIDDYLKIGVGLIAGLAIVLASAAVLRHERTRVALSGAVLGGLAIGFQLFTWTIMMIVGGLLIISIIYALRDVFGDIFGGLFDG